MTTDLLQQYWQLRLEIKQEQKHLKILTKSRQNWRQMQPNNHLRLANFRTALSYHRVKLINSLERLEELSIAMREERECQRLLPELDRLLNSDLPIESPQ